MLRDARDKAPLLILLSTYGMLARTITGCDGDIVVVRSLSTGRLNLKSSMCNNMFIKRTSSRVPNCCEPCFDVHKSKIRVQLFKKMESYASAEDALKSQLISPIQHKALQSFVEIPDKHHNHEGKMLKDRVRLFLVALKSNLAEATRGSDSNDSLPGHESARDKPSADGQRRWTSFAAFRASMEFSARCLMEECAEHIFALFRNDKACRCSPSHDHGDEKVQRRKSALVKHSITSQNIVGMLSIDAWVRHGLPAS